VNQITPLASGQITPTDALTVVLVEPDDIPATVVVHWPARSTVVDPRRFPEVASAVVKLFAEAHTTLAGIKAWGRL
jgi:hypothetical protein